MSEALSPLAPERQLVEAAREMVAALTTAKTTIKQRHKLNMLAARARAMRPQGDEASNVVAIRGPRAPEATSDEARARAALADLILQAVEAVRARLGTSYV